MSYGALRSVHDDLSATLGSQNTRKDPLVDNVPLGVTTSTLPVVAPAGTVVMISVGDTTVKVAATPLKATLVAPVRSVPRIFTLRPGHLAVGTVSTNGLSPIDNRKTVPQPSVQAVELPPA